MAPRQIDRARGVRFTVMSRVALGLLAVVGTLAIVEVSKAIPAEAGATSLIVSPAPGSRTASSTTQISFLGASASATSLRSISVVGSRSGKHAGQLRDYSGGRGASFLPKKPFVAGETVTVRVSLPVVDAEDGTFRFVIGDAVPVSGAVQHQYRTSGTGVVHFASEPSISPSQVSVKPTAATASEGDFFLAPKGAVGQPGPMILNSAGQLVWFHPLSDPNEYAMNFSEQRYRGKPVLTWWQGNVVAAHGQGEDVIMNSSYKTIAVVHAGNGFQADLHDFQLTGQTAWITTYQALHWNLTSVGGLSTGIVWDGIVQEIDVKTGLVMYEWHSLDHVPVVDSYFRTSANTSSRLDYFHINAIDVVSPTQIVVSSRNTSAVYDISLADGGAVRWVLGGQHSTFALGTGVRFNLQHDVRLHDGNTITLFDNNASPVYGQSKALVISLDFATKQATLVRSITHQPPLIGTALGNVQTFSNGNLLVSWGTTHYFDEYSSTGSVLFEGLLATGDNSYRIFRSPWSATPSTLPKLALQHLANGDIEAFVSWNGATNVAKWQVLEGANAKTMHIVSTTASSGFETAIVIPRPSRGVVIARAIGSNGRVLRATTASRMPS